MSPRKYPRAACNYVAELEVRHHRPDGRVARVLLPARMSTVAPEGLGFQIDAPWGLLLRRDDAVVSRFAMAGTRMEIPGRVVWCASGRAGVELQLGAMTAAMRAAFAEWAVTLIAQAQAAAAEPLAAAGAG